jgi:putative ABC transport system ATP-binding protein
MATATSALDAESETLVNSALAALLRGNNTTISIAHRLSTIKRSDSIIVLSNDGKVAEHGSYKDLSSDPNSAFTKLMEWQMSGGDAPPTYGGGEGGISGDGRGPLSETEEINAEREREEHSEEEIEEEGIRVRGEKETKAEIVLEKADKQP